ncbi:MAG: hypothetical protein ABI945_10035 [Nitrospirales bacterium]
MMKPCWYAIILLCLTSLVLSSCVGAPERDPDALSRAYDAPLAQVQEAARNGFQRLNLDILEDSSDHYLQGGKQSDVTGRGETVMVWLEDAGAGSTRVWIATQKPGWVWGQTCIDCSPKLLDHIQQDIQTRTRG